MNYEIITTETFERAFKSLYKKYRSLPDDLRFFKKSLLENPEIGNSLGGNIRKIRMAIASKHKGKSGGARIITCTLFLNVTNAEIYLLTIYDKNKQENISPVEIDQLKKESGLI